MTQAILMSLCLQSMVEELLRIRSGAKIKMVSNCRVILLLKRRESIRKIRFLIIGYLCVCTVLIFKAGEKSCSTEYLFPRKDGSTQRLQIRSGLHAEGACGGNSRLPKVR